MKSLVGQHGYFGGIKQYISEYAERINENADG